MWYNETGSITTVRWNFRTRYQRTPPSRNTILNRVRNFELRGSVENRNASGRPSITPQTILTVSSCFRAYPRRSLRRAQTDLYWKHTGKVQLLQLDRDRVRWNCTQHQAFKYNCEWSVLEFDSIVRSDVSNDACVFDVDKRDRWTQD